MTRTPRPECSGEPAPLLGGVPLLAFVGKGGVGKTTAAAGAALAAARAGERVLVASIDPAHSLGDALAAELGAEPRSLALAEATLDACELDASAAWERWLAERRDALRSALARGTWLDEAALGRFLELAPPGLDELMALEELERLGAAGGYARVVVDPSPTGHLLRLVDAPDVLARLARSLEALDQKHRVLARTLGGARAAARADPTAQAIEQLAAAAARLAAWVRDPARCAFVWVLTPEALELEETLAGAEALARRGVGSAAVVLQRAARAPRTPCARCERRARAGRALEAELAARLGPLPLVRVPELAREPRGAGLAPIARAFERRPRALRRVSREPAPEREARAGPEREARAGLEREARAGPERDARAVAQRALPASALDAPDAFDAFDPARLAPPGLRLLVVAGKGGVGKSSCAATLALACARARAGERVLLASVDPAHSLSALLEERFGDEARALALEPWEGEARPARLLVRELDAQAAFESRRAGWKRAVDEAFAARTGPHLDARLDREALSELLELAPPGVDELGALLALIEELGLERSASARAELVVLDTPASGHALELLALPEPALAWVHGALELVLALPESLRPAALAEELLGAARALRALRALLADPARARCVVVARPAELPRRESARLARALERLGIELSALILLAPVARAGESACARCRAAARARAAESAALVAALPRRARERSVRIVAPLLASAPRGPRALAAWGRAWRLADEERAPRAESDPSELPR